MDDRTLDTGPLVVGIGRVSPQFPTVDLVSQPLGAFEHVLVAAQVNIDGAAVRSCSFPVSAAGNRAITTVEGLSPDRSHALQRAWIAEQVPQCGYCQSGMLMAANALLRAIANPSDAEIDAAITNICRCGTYTRVRKAIHRAAQLMRETQ